MLVQKNALIFLAILLLTAGSAVATSPYNPHQRGGPPWFEGWYSRVISENVSFGFIVASGNYPSNATAAYVGVLYQLYNSQQTRLQHAQSRPDRYSVSVDKPRSTLYRPLLSAAPGFEIASRDEQNNTALLVAEGRDFHFQAEVQGITLSLTAVGPATAWGHGGPEGPILTHLGLLNLNWYVQSLGTPVQFSLQLPPAPEACSGSPPAADSPARLDTDTSVQLTGPAAAPEGKGSGGGGRCGTDHNDSDGGTGGGGGTKHAQPGGRLLEGHGFVHLEKNWGQAFPRHWLWVQGIKASGRQPEGRQPEVILSLAGGVAPLPKLISDLLPDVFLIGFRSPALRWDFHPTDPTLYFVSSDACSGRLRLTAADATRRLVVEVSAPPGSFRALPCPTATGFRDNAVESYVARAVITASKCRFLGTWCRVVETQVLDRVALEFGGEYRCSYTAST